MHFNKISVNRYGAIVRKDTEGRLHSDWWIPTMIAPDGYIEYYDQGCIYYIEHPKINYYVYGEVAVAGSGPSWNRIRVSGTPPDGIHIPKSEQ